jgi:hypothetical protein
MTIEAAIKEIRQSRSRYQLEKFVLGQHHSPEMQYYQLVLEASGLISAIKESELNIQKLKAEAEELRETGKKSDAIEAQIKELRVEDYELNLIGTRRELGYLKELFEQFPKFSREEIEAGQKDYWETRLMRVGQLQMLSRQGGVDWAQLEALHQANIIEQALLEIPSMSHLQNNTMTLPIQERTK